MEEKPPPQTTIWSIGHSNHPLETFLDLLQQHRIATLVDVRSSPYSGYASHFNKEAVQHSLRHRGIEYLFLGNLLGGRVEGEQFYDEAGHVLYDRVAGRDAFRQGIRRLLDSATSCRVALLCGEEDPTDCHRRLLIGRVLRQRGVDVVHIRGDGAVQSDAEVAAAEEFRRTKGQLTLFDMEETDQWKSTRSVLPKKPPPSSSRPSSGPGSDA